MKEMKLNIFGYYNDLSEIEKKMFEIDHKIKCNELRMEKYCKIYSNCCGSDKSLYNEYIIKCKIEKADLECELKVLIEEYRTYKEEFEAEYGKIYYCNETILND